MTEPAYTEPEPGGIDVTPLVGRNLPASDHVLFARYNTAFQTAIYDPCVETFRACVVAYDDMINGGRDGAHPHGQT